MRRTIRAIFTLKRPHRMSRSAWRGPARKGTRPEARDVQARRDDAHHLDGAAREAERRREDRVAARPVDGLVERRGQHALLDVALELGSLEVALERVTGAHAPRAEVRGVTGGLAA